MKKLAIALLPWLVGGCGARSKPAATAAPIQAWMVVGVPPMRILAGEMVIGGNGVPRSIVPDPMWVVNVTTPLPSTKLPQDQQVAGGNGVSRVILPKPGSRVLTAPLPVLSKPHDQNVTGGNGTPRGIKP